MLVRRVPGAVAACVVVVLGCGGVVALTSFQTWSTVLIALALGAGSLVALNVLGAKQSDPRIRRLLLLAVLAKLAAGVARWGVNALLYDGGGDSNLYSLLGQRLSQSWLQGDFIGSGRRLPGTGFIDGLTAAVYAVTGPTFVGGFLVFAWIGFWGLYLCFRAFQIGLPDGDHYRYALLVLLLPSLLFWPSAIGKDAWMVLCIGLFSYGAARLLTGARGGLLAVALGGLGAGYVRPHITLILVFALAVGFLARPSSAAGGGGTGKALILVVVLTAGFVALTQVSRFFNLEGDQTLVDALDQTSAQTAQGGSAFDGASVRNPLTLPYGIVTVLFRPFPYEANSLQALATSLEGLFLLALSVRAVRRVRGRTRALIRKPYVVFSLVYVLLFGTAFSSFNNFGILTRQRVQVFPLALVLLALPRPQRELATPHAARANARPRPTSVPSLEHSGP